MVNGMVGRVVDILYAAGTAPPAPPVGVVVAVPTANYKGPAWNGNVARDFEPRTDEHGNHLEKLVVITPKRAEFAWRRRPASRLQLPLELAWALTIHKSQGLSLRYIILDLGSLQQEKRSPGLAYVALTRAMLGWDGIAFDPVPEIDPATGRMPRFHQMASAKVEMRQAEERRLAEKVRETIVRLRERASQGQPGEFTLIRVGPNHHKVGFQQAAQE